MAAPFSYRDLGELMGSWPISVLKDPSPAQQLQPNSLQTKATMTGTRREPTAGYNIGGLSLSCYVDVAGTPTLHAVSFPAGTGLGSGGTNYFTLAQVISRFQASTPALPANTARNSDRFLLLQSQTAGETSYLRVESVLGAEGVFDELGLQPGIIVKGGDLKTAQHIDPTRQVAGVTQLALQHGENFSADTMNRMLMQLAVNAGTARGTLDLRRVAVKTKQGPLSGPVLTPFTVQLNLSNPAQGVYTGPITTPSFDQLLDIITVLDANGNEFTSEYESVLTGPSADYTFSVEPDTSTNTTYAGKQICTSATASFAAGDVAANRYVKVTNFGAAAALNGKPIKIVEYISSTIVVVQPIDPATGAVLTITESNRSGSRIEIFHVRAEIEGLSSDAAFTTRVEGNQIARSGGSGAVTRVESPNRIFVSGASFTTDTKQGDLVTWSGAATTSPYSNNGTYRVARVIDDKRLELVTSDYSPCYLNPSIGFGLGSISVTSDGEFFRTPYAKFAEPTAPNLAAGRGAIPAAGQTYYLAYNVEKTIKSALTTSAAALAPSVRYDAEVSADVQKALMRLAGPSTTSFAEILHGNFDLSLEKLDYRVDKEHFESTGRHSNIRPNTIDMFPNLVGTTVTFRGNDADASTVSKVRFLQETAPATYEERLAIRNNGDLAFTTSGGSATPHVPGQGLAVRFGDHSRVHKMALEWAASSTTALALLRLNILNDGASGTRDNVLAIDAEGRVGVNMAQAIAETGVAGDPQTTFHIRARSTTDEELIRLEGFDAARRTVGIGFKPNLTDGKYGFIEVDNAGTGDWFMNFATTEDARDDAVAGGSGDGLAGFRWVQQVGGSVEEIFTIRGAPGGLGFAGPAAIDLDSAAATGDAPTQFAWHTGATTTATKRRVRLEARKYNGSSEHSWRLRMVCGDRTTGLDLARGTLGSAVSIARNVETILAGAGITTGLDYPLVVNATGSNPALVVEDSGTGVPKLAFASADHSAITDVMFSARSRRLEIRSDATDAAQFGALGLALPNRGGSATPRAQLDISGDTFGYDAAILLAQTTGAPTHNNGTRKTIRWNLVTSAPSTAAQLRLQPIWEQGTASAGAADPGLALLRNAFIGGAGNVWDSDDTAKTSQGFFMESAQSNGVVDKFSWRFAPATAGAPAWVNRMELLNGTSPALKLIGDIEIASDYKYAAAHTYEAPVHPHQGVMGAAWEQYTGVSDPTDSISLPGPGPNSAFIGDALVQSSGVANRCAVIPVHLPKGAVITGCTAYFVDPVAGGNIKLGLYRADKSGIVAPVSLDPSSPAVNVAVPTISGPWSVPVPVGSPGSIDNNQYNYFLWIGQSAAATWTLSFRGASVQFTTLQVSW